MAFLRSSAPIEPFVARGAAVGLRPLAMADYAAWTRLRQASRDHLTPWEPQWSADEFERSAFRRRVKHYQHEQREDLGYALAIFTLADETLVGGISLSNVRRGVTQSAQLGYWLGAAHIRQGWMTDAVSAVLPFAFFGLRLHRVEAATLPENTASIRVLERNGFAREGFARRYLKINGAWRDHVLFALIGDDYRAARQPASHSVTPTRAALNDVGSNDRDAP
jgi:ribosomal-protein-alanine N-acetyltransferase